MEKQSAVKVAAHVQYDEIIPAARPLPRSNWKPFSTRMPFLGFVVTFLLLCIVALEVLVRNSAPLPESTRAQRLFIREPATTQSTSAITNPSSYVNLDDPTSTTNTFPKATTNPDAYLKVSSTSTYSPVAPSATPPAAYLTLTSTSTTPLYAPVASSTTSPYGSPLSDAGKSTTPIAVISLPTTVSTSSTSSRSDVVDVVSNLKRPDRQVNGTFTRERYFVAMYLPSILAVVVKELWAAIASGFKLMEPFYLLNQPYGALALESLMTDHLGSTTSLDTLRGVLRCNWLIMATLLLDTIVTFLAPIASESMTVISTLKVYFEDGSSQRMNSIWILSLPFVRTLQGLLSAIAFLLLWAAFYSWGRHSGLAANPSKIATIASLLGHPQVVHDLQSIQPNASDKQIRQAIAHDRYMIATYQDMDGSYQSGLVKLGDTVPQGRHQVPVEDTTNPDLHVRSPVADGRKVRRIHGSSTLVLVDILFLVLILGLLGTIVAFYLDGKDDGFNRFFNSGNFGPRFILSLGASFATMTFQHLERQVRLAAPYQQLATRQARPKSTISWAVNGTALSNLFGSFRHGTYYHSFIALTVLLGDVLIITVTGVPFNGSLTWLSFQLSVFISIGIIAIMVGAAISIFRWRHNNKNLGIPQRPNEPLIRVCMSLSNQDNHLRSSLSDLSDKPERSIRRRLKQSGGRYWAGWIKDNYGRDMWCVDKEYEHIDAPYH